MTPLGEGHVGRDSAIPTPGEHGYRESSDPSGELEVVEPGEVGHRAAAPDDRQGVVGACLVRLVGCPDGFLDRPGGVRALEGRPSEGGTTWIAATSKGLVASTYKPVHKTTAGRQEPSPERVMNGPGWLNSG